MLQQVFWNFDWYQALRASVRASRAPRQIQRWETLGKHGPPPHAIKQQVLKHYARQYGLKILVESGTYHGDMLDALKSSFDKLYSIELGTALFNKAKWRFRRDPNIELINGDSGQELAKLVPRLAGPAVFWLDGHYSAGPTAHGKLSTPIYNELRHVLAADEKRHVIVIDDARCFGVERDYPTIDEVAAFIHAQRPDLKIKVECDSIQVFPSNA